MLIVAWEAPQERRWFPIGQLGSTEDRYTFAYTRGAREAQEKCKFQPLRSFPELDRIYESETLFPLFANRIPPRGREDYHEWVQCLNVRESEDDPLVLLARTAGRRATDTLEVFPCPTPDEQMRYHIHFFAHGVRHFPEASARRIHKLEIGETLMLMHDFQNPYDQRALALRTSDTFDGDRFLVGYCPRYLVEDFFELLRKRGSLPEVLVERVNPPPAPIQMRLLCMMTGCWPKGFRPFSGEKFKLIVDEEVD